MIRIMLMREDQNYLFLITTTLDGLAVFRRQPYHFQAMTILLQTFSRTSSKAMIYIDRQPQTDVV